MGAARWGLQRPGALARAAATPAQSGSPASLAGAGLGASRAARPAPACLASPAREPQPSAHPAAALASASQRCAGLPQVLTRGSPSSSDPPPPARSDGYGSSRTVPLSGALSVPEPAPWAGGSAMLGMRARQLVPRTAEQAALGAEGLQAQQQAARPCGRERRALACAPAPAAASGSSMLRRGISA